MSWNFDDRPWPSDAALVLGIALGGLFCLALVAVWS